MALQPGSSDSQRQIGAAIAIVATEGMGDEMETTMVVSWFLGEGSPFMGADEVYGAIEVTGDLLAQTDALVERNPDFVPEGFTAEAWAFFRQALRDGLTALEAELPEFEQLEVVSEDLESLYDALVMTGLVDVPVLADETPVDMTE